MKEITVEEFIEKIKMYYNEIIYIELEGNIEEGISTKLDEVKKFRNFIELIYEKNKKNFFGEKLKINIKKLKKLNQMRIQNFIFICRENKKL